MLKKLASSLILGSLLASSAFAGDFLAKVSNGALSDNSQGVKVLNLDEMKQVKGGYGLVENSSGASVFVFQNINSGMTRLSQIGVIAGLTPYEEKNKVSCGFGGDGCSPSSFVNTKAYNEFVSIANPNLGEFLAVTATKTTIINPILGIPQVKFSNGGIIVGINGDTIYKIRSATATNTVAQEVLRKIGNDLNKILVTQFK
ncbi:TPA: bacteriocin [Campylobacter jejuni]